LQGQLCGLTHRATVHVHLVVPNGGTPCYEGREERGLRVVRHGSQKPGVVVHAGAHRLRRRPSPQQGEQQQQQQSGEAISLIGHFVIYS
jgi:hypothetical protein